MNCWRVFVAVEIPAVVRQELAGLLVDLRRQSGTVVRWVKPEIMHLTLVFLGELPEMTVSRAGELAAATVAAVVPFACRLEGLGAFPSPERARVVWTGLDEGRSELSALQRLLSKSLQKIGYVPERRPFSPHLTLGRLRSPADVRSLVGQRFTSSSFTVERVTLFRSVLRPEGPEYTALGNFPLTGDRA